MDAGSSWIPAPETYWISSTAPGSKPFVYLASPFRELGGRFSPGGKWIAYVSDETGRSEVYVRPFSGGPATAEGKIQISERGGDFPVWNPAAQELFYISLDRKLYAVDVSNLGRSNRAPAAVKLFDVCPGRSLKPNAGGNAAYAVPYDTHDGKRFVINCTVEAPGRFLVLLNWMLGPRK